VVCATLVTALAGCDDSPADGNGEIVTETRAVDEFNEVRVANGAAGFFTVDPSTSGQVELAITTGANLIEFVTTEVSGETLRLSIDSSGEPRSTQGFEIMGTAGTLRAVEASKGGKVTTS
jgi:hypothetical protein